jgi:hypothetical protein
MDAAPAWDYIVDDKHTGWNCIFVDAGSSGTTNFTSDRIDSNDRESVLRKGSDRK